MNATGQPAERREDEGLAAARRLSGVADVIWTVPPRDTAAAPSARVTAIDVHAELARHHEACFGWALACCKWDPTVAEDVLQTAYLKVIDGRARFRGRGEFRAFLFAVIRHTARDERRRRLVRQVLPLSWLTKQSAAHSAPTDGVEGLVRAETSRRLMCALDQLSARQRDVLLLVFYHDMTIAAAAEVLGVSVGTARVHYERGKAQLRRLLSEE
jgi:RNA polymerase sigma-70 factor (ECF subfamily)